MNESNQTATKMVELNVESASAYYLDGCLIITAKGEENRLYSDIHIIRDDMPIIPPIFSVVAPSTFAIGSAPYTVHGVFAYGPNPPANVVVGGLEVEVEIIGRDKDATRLSPEASLADNEVVGYSYNSFDVDAAIADAVRKLEKKHPADVSAVVTETGVVAAGTPVGIAFLYVKMAQQS